MNYLPVGHTHEDVDGFFGVLAQYMSHTDAYTLDGKLKAGCQTSLQLSIPS